ncbi:MAG: response regulator [Deinococcales bacterium]
MAKLDQTNPKPTIICVDDEKMVLVSLKQQLRRAFAGDYDIDIAESAEEALEIMDELMEDGAEIPVIISDQIMPQIKGHEFLALVHQRLPLSRTILLTGQADAEAIGLAVNEAKLYRYISKPGINRLNPYGE